MPTISQKGVAMPESPIRKLVPFAESAKVKGRVVYHLNIGQPDIESPVVAMDKLRNLDINVIEYSHSAGFESYREGLSAYYAKVGITVQPDEMIVTSGGSEALFFGMMSCFNPGDEVIIPEPFYANYLSFAIAAGVKVVPLTCHIEDGFALPSAEEFDKVMTPKTRGIIICNPSNPAGSLYSEKELLALRDLILQHDLFLFADEVYREFCYEGAVPLSVMNLAGIEQNVVLIDSVSKRYSMCGARIGVLVSHNKNVVSTVLKFAQARLSPPTLGQIAAEAALETPDSYFEAVTAEYVTRRNILVDGLNALDGVVCPKPAGAFYAIASLPVADADHFCQWLLESFEYQNQTVMMAPASGFYATPGMGKNQVRIAYVLNQDALKKALICIREALKAYDGK